MDVTAESFERDVIERSRELPVVVNFWAEWCGPCRMLTPVLEREVEARAGEVELAKVDVDANQELASRYGVSGIPAVKAFRNGRVAAAFVGARPPASVALFLDELTGPSALEALLGELRESGEAPDVVAALDDGDHRRALDLLLAEVEAAPEPERRQLVVRAMVAIFEELGQEHPLSSGYRRRLATAIY